jgi:hypothetical protein
VEDRSSADGGTYHWARRSCTPRTGGFALWAVGGGAQGGALACGAHYPNRANTRTIYGPFDLREAASGTLIYHLRGRSEGGAGCPFDYLGVGSTTSLDLPFTGTRLCGDYTGGLDGNGYTRFTLDLAGRLGSPQVWVMFEFVSDGSATDIGFTLDDVTLDVVDSGGQLTISGAVRNYDGGSVPGVIVYASGGATYQAVPGPGGAYTITLPPGVYSVRADSSDPRYPSPAPQQVTVPPSRTGIDFVFPQAYGIAGTVRGTGGAPLAGANVFDPDRADVSTRTDAQGRYALTVAAGTYKLRVIAPGYLPQERNVSLPPTRANEDFTLGTTPTGTATTTATTTATRTATSTATATRTATATSTRERGASVEPRVFLPLVGGG